MLAGNIPISYAAGAMAMRLASSKVFDAGMQDSIILKPASVMPPIAAQHFIVAGTGCYEAFIWGSKNKQESSAFLKKSAQKTFDSSGRLSGQTVAAQRPAVLEVFCALFFKKALLTS